MNRALRILNGGDRYYSALIIQRLEDDGRASSRPRQWKHGHERARLTPKTQKASGWLQKIQSTIWKRNPVSNVAILQGPGAQASLPALSSAKSILRFPNYPLKAMQAGCLRSQVVDLICEKS